MRYIWLTETMKEVANLWGKEYLKDKGCANIDEMSPEEVIVEMIRIGKN